MPLTSHDVHEALAKFTGSERVALHEPCFAGHEWTYVKDCIDTGWVSSAGKYVERFEQKLAEVCGTRHAVAVVNGTAALHLALLLFGVKPGEEVLVPAMTFVATANAVVHAGAIPHFADSEMKTLGLDAAKLKTHLEAIAIRRGGSVFNRETGRRLAAIVPMHTFGHPCDMDGLLAVAEEFGIPLLEDAAEALGSSYRGKPCGSFGLLAALSFNGNKIVTTGGGGAIVTDDPSVARRAKHLSTTAKLAHAWAFEHDEVGWNYRMPNINAALGVAQLEQLPAFLAAKARLAERWQEVFAGMDGLRMFVPLEHVRSNHWLNALILDPEYRHLRDEILDLTNHEGLMTRPVWKLMHRLPAFADCPRMNLDVAVDLEQRIINIPSSAKLGGDAGG